MNILNRFSIEETPSPTEVPILRQGFDKLLAEMNLNEGCEVGVLSGKHAKKMLDQNPNLHLHLVDSYKFYSGIPKRQNDVARYLPEMRERLKGYNCTEHIEYSMDAVRKFKDKSLDFVYIDSNHRFDFIMQDLIEWSKKVRIGGIVSGHDYAEAGSTSQASSRKGMRQRTTGVTQAVDAYTKVHKIKFYVTSKGRKHPDSTRTFFWIKE